MCSARQRGGRVLAQSVCAGIDVGAACIKPGCNWAAGGKSRGAGGRNWLDRGEERGSARQGREGRTGYQGQRGCERQAFGHGQANADAGKGTRAGDDGDGGELRRSQRGGGQAGLDGGQNLLLGFARRDGPFGEGRLRGVGIEERNVADLAAGIKDQKWAHDLMVVPAVGICEEFEDFALATGGCRTSYGNIRAVCGVYRCRGVRSYALPFASVFAGVVDCSSGDGAFTCRSGCSSCAGAGVC